MAVTAIVTVMVTVTVAVTVTMTVTKDRSSDSYWPAAVALMASYDLVLQAQPAATAAGAVSTGGMCVATAACICLYANMPAHAPSTLCVRLLCLPPAISDYRPKGLLCECSEHRLSVQPWLHCQWCWGGPDLHVPR